MNLIIALVIVNEIVRRLTMSPETKNIVWLIVGLLFLLTLFATLGLFPGYNGIVFIR